MIMTLADYMRGLSHLFFPNTCTGCDQPLGSNEDLVCTDCWYHMPYTDFHLQADNDTARQLWGRVKVDAAASFLFFREASRVQRIMHHFKYRNTPRIGVLMGLRYGGLLRYATGFASVDLVVPVPLHPKKLRERGYNQSAYFAEGLAQSLGKPMLPNALARKTAGESQTHKSRYERYQNMQDTFQVNEPGALAHRHVLLVDDVLTTGATIEACAQALLACEGVRVSVATIARAVS